MLCLSCLCSPAFPDFQLVRTPGLGAALLSDELCSFRLKKNPDNKHKKNPHQPVPCIYIQLCYSWNLGYPHSPGEYLPPISWQSSMARGSSLAKRYFRGLHFKDCFFFSYATHFQPRSLKYFRNSAPVWVQGELVAKDAQGHEQVTEELGPISKSIQKSWYISTKY